jgi:hypothetical protein
VWNATTARRFESHPQAHVWDSALEAKLHAEWDALGQARSWEDAKVGVHLGWDFANLEPRTNLKP